MNVDLDIFEMGYLLDTCLRGSHLRSCTVDRFVDEWYDMLTESQRCKLYEWTLRLTYNGEFKPQDPCCGSDIAFMARYNPDNQYEVTTKYNGKVEKHRTFLYEGEYHTTRRRSILREYITNVEKLNIKME